MRKRQGAAQALRGGLVVSPRRLRLFLLVLCERFREWITDARCLAVLQQVEEDLRGSPTLGRKRQLDFSRMVNHMRSYESVSSGEDVIRQHVHGACTWLFGPPLAAAFAVSHRITQAAAASRAAEMAPEALTAAAEEEDRLQADLLRHVVGNPFRSFPQLPALPAAVVQLATSLEAGSPVAFALRDALPEAGHAEVAEHFASDAVHPRGCWALDLIRGRS